MLAKRIIPCLDVKEGRTVKGVNFLSLRDAGDPVTLAEHYSNVGADELVLLDITATIEERSTFIDTVRAVAGAISIPFTVGGGIRSVKCVNQLIRAGADKVAVNSAALHSPSLINELAREFGRQSIVVAIDSRRIDGTDYAYRSGGTIRTTHETVAWAIEAAERGAGEILLTSMDHDGTKGGFAIELTAKLSSSLSIPVIASGGGGESAHFAQILSDGKADAALAASVFHFNEITIPSLKRYLRDAGIEVRL